MVQNEKAAVRAAIFGHLAGIVLAPTVKALWDRKVFDLFDGGAEWVKLDEVVDRTRGNRGYLRVALRLLAACGWFQQRLEDNGRSAFYALTCQGRIALNLAPSLYGEVISFIPKAVFLEDFLFGSSDAPVLPSLEPLVLRAREHWGIPAAEDPITATVHAQVRGHLNGMLVGPAMVALARGGVLAQLERGPARLDAIAGNRTSLSCIFDLLATEGWVGRDQDVIQLTLCGLYAAQIATSYGVTVSYLPNLNMVSTLLFGNPRIPRIDDSGVELYVNRGMNVWGSGGAHKTYFNKVDEIVIEVFNRPLEQQPQGICDMGCGDGTLLEHLYSVVKDRTAPRPRPGPTSIDPRRS